MAMYRAVIEFDEETNRTLCRLAVLLRTNECEVVKFAISTYDHIVGELERTGKKLAIIGKDGKTEKIIDVPGL